MLSLLQLALLAVLGWGACAETGCPPKEDIWPCECMLLPSPVLTCKRISELDVLRDVFKKSENYFYQEVRKLSVYKSQMEALFDSSPKSDSLYEIQLLRSHFEKTPLFESGVLKNLTNLLVVDVKEGWPYSIKIPADFGSRFPSSVREITLRNSPISNIASGAFDGLENLHKLSVRFSELDILKRDMFPRPFNVKYLYIAHNEISSLSGDLFAEMPNLQIVTLRNNSLSVLPEEAFAGRSRNLRYLDLSGNPLDCNCLLAWLIKDKPDVLHGTCDKPIRLHGRHLQDLVPSDFNC